MQNKANPTLIGAFVLSALMLGIMAIFYLGGKGFSESSSKYILYFEGDVKGLQPGSPVTLRGVSVGQVEQIAIAYDHKEQRFAIPVIISIDQTKLGFDAGDHEGPGPLLLENMIEQGLRARLNIKSLLTSKMEVELDFHPNTPIRRLDKSSDYTEIPTIPSHLEKIASALEELPLERMVRRITEIMDGMDKLISGTDIPDLVSHLVSVIKRLDKITTQLEQNTPKLTASTVAMIDESRQMIGELKTNLKPLISEWTRVGEDSRLLMGRLDGRLVQAMTNWDQAMDSGEAAFKRLEGSAASAQNVLREDSPVMNEMALALRELAAAARSIRIMAEYLERHPEALLKGKQ